MSELLRPEITMPTAPRRLVPRVYAERPGTSFEAVSYRVRKALMAGDQAAAAEAYRTLDPDQRDAFQKSLDDPDTVTKGYWDSEKRQYSAINPRPAQTAEPAAPVKPRLQIAPMTGSGFLREIKRGSVVHFDLEGIRHHGKVLKWGKVGATVVTATGDVAAVTWQDLKFGVAPESADEAVAKSMSVPLYEMRPEQRAAFFKIRDGADFQKAEPDPEHISGNPEMSLKSRRWQKLWQRIA